jgi:hypothetical protein
VGRAVLPLDSEKEVLHSRSEWRSWAAASFSTIHATFGMRHPTSRETKFAFRLSANVFASRRRTLRGCGSSDRAVAGGSLRLFARSATLGRIQAGKRLSCRSRADWKGAPTVFAARREFAPGACSHAKSEMRRNFIWSMCPDAGFRAVLHPTYEIFQEAVELGFHA